MILGTDTYTIPCATNEWGITITVVLFLGPSRDVSCYRGVGSPKWVAAHGECVKLEQAIEHFPFLRSHCIANELTFCGARIEEEVEI